MSRKLIALACAVLAVCPWCAQATPIEFRHPDLDTPARPGPDSGLDPACQWIEQPPRGGSAAMPPSSAEPEPPDLLLEQSRLCPGLAGVLTECSHEPQPADDVRLEAELSFEPTNGLGAKHCGDWQEPADGPCLAESNDPAAGALPAETGADVPTSAHREAARAHTAGLSAWESLAAVEPLWAAAAGAIPFTAAAWLRARRRRRRRV